MGSSLKYVDHTYRDFSRYIGEDGQLIKHKKYEELLRVRPFLCNYLDGKGWVSQIASSLWLQYHSPTYNPCVYFLYSPMVELGWSSIKMSVLPQYLTARDKNCSLVSWMDWVSSVYINQGLVSYWATNTVPSFILYSLGRYAHRSFFSIRFGMLLPWVLPSWSSRTYLSD